MDEQTVHREKNARLWDREPDNWYVEPRWCSARLFEAEPFDGEIIDPCAGIGTIVAAARDAGLPARGFDLRDRTSYGATGVIGNCDFFADDGGRMPGAYPCDNIVSNPPYGRRTGAMPGERGRLEEEFLRLALARSRRKVALFLQTGWMNSAERGAWLETTPLFRIWSVGPRPSCPPGSFLAAGGKAGNGTADYAWFVWLHGYDGPPSLRWLRRDG